MNKPYLRLLPPEEEEKTGMTARKVMILAAAVCGGLAVFWSIWKRLKF